MTKLNLAELCATTLSLLLVIAKISYCRPDPATVSGRRLERPSNANYTVLLSLDGGGLRGVITTLVLVELEDAIKNYLLEEHPDLLPEDVLTKTADDFDISLADFVDFVGGTSAGSLVGAHVASKGGNGRIATILNERRFVERYGRISPESARGLLIFFFEFGNTIFPHDIVPKSVFNPGTDPRLPGVIRPILNPKFVTQILDAIYENMTMSELSTSAAFVAYDLLVRSGVLFVHDKIASPPRTGFSKHVRTNGPRSPGDSFAAAFRGQYGLDFRIKDVVTGCIAVPVAFPAAEFFPVSSSEPRCLAVDGLLLSVDPLVPVLTHLGNSTGDTSFSSIAVFSVGNGLRIPNLADDANGGRQQWDSSGDRLGFGARMSSEIRNKQIEFLYTSNPDTRPGQFLRIQLFAGPETKLARLLAADTNSLAVPSFAAVGEEIAATYSEAIAAFVQDFIFS